MPAVASTLTAWRIGGQLDPSWALDAGEAPPWTAVRAVATIGPQPTTGHITDPTNGAHEWPLSTGNLIQAADSGGLWWTDPLKPTTGPDVSGHLNPLGLTWTICVAVLHTNGEWVPAGEWVVSIDGDRDYAAASETFTTAETESPEAIDIGYLVAASVGSGPTVVPSVVNIPDSTTRTVAVSGQLVAAGGSGSTVVIDPSVETFTITEHPSGTAWSPGVVPTFSTSGGQTVDPSVATALAAADGDEVTVYRIGDVWYASTPTATGAAGEDLQVFSETAVEAISAGQVVALTGAGVVVFDPTGGPGVYGVASTAATAGNPVQVVTDGRLELPGSTLTPGAPYWADVDGSLTAVMPTSGTRVAIGYAADADTFVVQVGDPIQLA